MKVIVAPLNWGLGHATRCIPIIRELLAQGATPILASDGAALALLRREFPTLTTLELPSYNISYAKSGGFRLALKMLFLLPFILKAIVLEYFFIRKYCKNNSIQILISDNRFGLIAPPPVSSLFLTHQIEIQTPFRFTTWLVNLVNHFFLKRFDEIWIPDAAEFPNLSGKLSHGNFSKRVRQKMTFIEPLSRFTRPLAPVEKQFDIAVVLSGPEPQRTILENKIWQQLHEILNFEKNAPPPVIPPPAPPKGGSKPFLTVNSQILWVRGTHEPNPNIKNDFKNIEIHNLLISKELEIKINQSKVIISRSGYSSLMDWAALGISQVLLIPTPGQTEQEYLATYFSNQKYCFSESQTHFQLADALSQMTNFKGFYNFPLGKNEILREKIRQILKKNTERTSTHKH